MMKPLNRLRVPKQTRAYTASANTEGIWSRLASQGPLVRPALLLVIFGSAAVNYSKEKKQLDDIEVKYSKKLKMLNSILSRLDTGENVDLHDELKLINKSFEYAGYRGTYFKGYVDKPERTEEDDLGSVLAALVKEPEEAKVINNEKLTSAISNQRKGNNGPENFDATSKTKKFL